MAVLAQADAGVVEVLQKQVAAWNRGDLEAFCAAYADDAVFVSPTGVTRGRAQVLARYKAKYGMSAKQMGQLTLTPLDVRLAPDTASVAAEWKLVFEKKPAASGHTVVVLQRRGDSWLIVHDASM
jgi:uncharacterized protein (TIGR02246 family)